MHGVGLTGEDIETMRCKGCGLVWCPPSNLYLFGITAPTEKVILKIPVALSSHSTVTGSLSLFDEMRVARQAKHLSAPSILDLATRSPSKMRSLNNGEMSIGPIAHLSMIERNSTDPFDFFLKLSLSKARWHCKDGGSIYSDVGLESMATRGSKDFSISEMWRHVQFVIGNFSELTRRIKYCSLDFVPPKILPQ